MGLVTTVVYLADDETDAIARAGCILIDWYWLEVDVTMPSATSVARSIGWIGSSSVSFPALAMATTPSPLVTSTVVPIHRGPDGWMGIVGFAPPPLFHADHRLECLGRRREGERVEPCPVYLSISRVGLVPGRRGRFPTIHCTIRINPSFP